MNWLTQLFVGNSVAHTVLLLCLVISVGLVLGKIKILGVGMGVGGVLFSGLLFGHLGLSADPDVLLFVREFGLILFVYVIGLQVGPGFFSSFSKQGLKLNLLAAIVVAFGSLLAVLIGFIAHLDFQVVVGLLSGAVTNTPSLGAAQQALHSVQPAAPDTGSMVGMGYAAAYPFGIFGVILTMVLIRKIFHIDMETEAREFTKLQHEDATPLSAINFRITNENADGKSIGFLRECIEGNVVISRISHENEQHLATDSTLLHIGDVIRAVGTPKDLDHFSLVAGTKEKVDMFTAKSTISSRRVIATKSELIGKTLDEISLQKRFQVVVTRVIRAGAEFSPTGNMRLQLGDRLLLFGNKNENQKAAQEVGDSLNELEQPFLIPIFVGIGLGLILGSIPFSIPYIPAPIKLGMAGGPLIIAILMGRYGKIGPFVSYMPNATKKLIKELGIALFLACVGIASGEKFVSIIVEGEGLSWMLLAMIITFVPVFTIGLLARAIFKLNYISIVGFLAGSMTNPPALAFANQIVKNDTPTLSYATVYPLTMFMRVVVAQVIVLSFFE